MPETEEQISQGLAQPVEALRKSTREKPTLVYTATAVVDEYKWTKLLASRKFIPENFDRLKGSELTYEWASSRNGMKAPVLILEPTGLDMEMPQNLTVDLVAEYCGKDRIVDVIEVSTQTDRQMTLGEWADYFKLPVEQRQRILNVISLECGSTKLGAMIKSPKMVRELDWIDNIWPWEIKVKEYPQVQLYCLMGVQDSYTEYRFIN